MANNEQEGEPRRQRRRLGSDVVDAIIQRTYGNHNVNREISRSGPMYPVDDESFILNQKYKITGFCSNKENSICLSIYRFLSECPEEAWNERNNPNGIVPVVVNPKLVLGTNDLPLTVEQKDGIQFLWDCYENNTGGILAHDMGLGKVYA